MNVDRLAELYNNGHYQEAWWAYKALAARGEGSWEIYMYGSLAAQAMGRLHAALQTKEEGIRRHSGEGRGRLRFGHAILLLDMGRLDAAADEFQRWIADLSEYPSLEPDHLGLAYYHLGLICRQQERFAASIQQYATACEYLRRHNQRTYLVQVLQNLAWVACMVGDEATASAALDEALPLCDTPKTRWHQQIGQAYLLAVARYGDLRMAMTLCEEIIQHKGDDVPPAVRSHAYWLAGRVALDLNLGETARAMAEQALVNAVSLGDERCLSDAYRLLADVDSRFVHE